MRLLRAELSKLDRPLTWGVAGAAAVFCVLLAVGGAHNAALKRRAGPAPAVVRRAGDPGRAACTRAQAASGPGSGRARARPASPRS